MATRSLFFLLKRSCHNNHRSPALFYVKDQTPLRWFSSGALKVDSAKESSALTSSADDLKSRIFRLRFSKRSATNALQRWVNEGNKVSLQELRQIAKELNRAQRYKHALEISEWMVTHPEFELADHDYAVRIDLITKVFGTSSAEEFFEGLPPIAKTGETYTALLHSYASAKQIEKAEKLFARIKELKLALTVLMCNELMTLYMSVGELDKISLVVNELKIQKLSLDLFTYNLWASACAAKFDINGLNRILDEMSDDPNSDACWRTYVSLIRIYTIVGHLENSNNIAPVEAEKTITQREWITYDFLICLYTSLGDIERVGEIWRSLKRTSQTMTSRNYLCVLSSYVLVGRLKEAMEIVDEWKHSVLDFDTAECMRLLDAFGEVGLMEGAKQLHELLLQKDCVPMDRPQ
ncbi:pentatricopeptide repeat-containing protein At5g09450, mitochondrial [Aristolochia californica]|uniref:pentatricopeptide repeat-containing protein At5g09450, mitochondrial n=1 Tax=Aristolochia californica TaxID=171875 RepID=UPI0035DF82AB